MVARRARAREAAALQSALEVLVGELRIGAHPVSAFEVAAGEVDGPVAAILSAVAARARLGADVAAGLRSSAASSRLAGHWQRLALFWRLAQAHGLAIATLMRAAHRDIVERERFPHVSMREWRVPAPQPPCWRDCPCSESVSANSSGRTRWDSCSPAGSAGGYSWPVSCSPVADCCGRMPSRDGRRHDFRLSVGGRTAGCRCAVARSPTRGRSTVPPHLRCRRATLMRSLSHPLSTCSLPASHRVWRCHQRLLRPRRRLRSGSARCSAEPPTCWLSARIRLRHGRIRSWPLDDHGEALLRLARRSATSGAALAHGVADLADQSRHAAASAADARAQRASVLIAGPSGCAICPPSCASASSRSSRAWQATCCGRVWHDPTRTVR